MYPSIAMSAGLKNLIEGAIGVSVKRHALHFQRNARRKDLAQSKSW